MVSTTTYQPTGWSYSNQPKTNLRRVPRLEKHFYVVWSVIAFQVLFSLFSFQDRLSLHQRCPKLFERWNTCWYIFFGFLNTYIQVGRHEDYDLPIQKAKYSQLFVKALIRLSCMLTCIALVPLDSWPLPIYHSFCKSIATNIS